MGLKQTYPNKKCLVFLKIKKSAKFSRFSAYNYVVVEEFGFNKANMATL